MRQQHPNVVLIVADNQACGAVGCYAGGDDFETPEIDRLAAEGARFTRFFASNGYCSGGRATMVTGLMPSQHGVHSWLQDEHLSRWPKGWCAVQELRTLPVTLKNRGYRTAHIGKWHLGDPYRAAPGYDDWLTFSVGHTLDFYDNQVIDNGREYRLEGRHIVDFFSERAVDWLRGRDGSQPFFLSLWYDGPYALPPTNLGPDPRNPYYEHFARKEFRSVPRVPVADNYVQQLKLATYPNDGQREELWLMLRIQNDLESLANFAAQCRLVDEGVGQVTQALDDAGLSKDTLVVFTTDQGNFFGQHGRWGHASYSVPSVLYDDIMNIPFIARQPGAISGGVVSDVLAGQYDIAPTITEWVGFTDAPYSASPSRSFARLLRGEAVDDWPDAVFFEQEESRGVRTARFAYWQRLQGAGDYWRSLGLDWDGSDVLFDMQADPGQLKNLAGDPAYRDVVAELDSRLTRFFGQHCDPAYDLWHGGSAKGSLDFPQTYTHLYGDTWTLLSESLPPFTEPN